MGSIACIVSCRCREVRIRNDCLNFHVDCVQVKFSDVIVGVPVATVGINNSINAALLAVRILGAFDAQIREKVLEYAKTAKHENLDVKGIKIKELGWETYYKQMEERK
jgi:hypothetical protein